MKMWLMRHAKTEQLDSVPDDRDAARAADYQRRLTDFGRQQAEKAGVVLRMSGANPSVVLTSPVVRCVETAQIVARHLGVPVQLAEELLPHKDISSFLRDLQDSKSVRRPYMVGHQDNMNPALAKLGGFKEDDVDPLETAEIRKIRLGKDGWAERWRWVPPSEQQLPETAQPAMTYKASPFGKK